MTSIVGIVLSWLGLLIGVALIFRYIFIWIRSRWMRALLFLVLMASGLVGFAVIWEFQLLGPRIYADQTKGYVLVAMLVWWPLFGAVFLGSVFGMERHVTLEREKLPEVRGVLTPDRTLSDLTWLRVGGPADWLFQPADEADLAAFLSALDPAIAVFPMGVGSNLIVRDGGIRAVVIRLGRGFNSIDIAGETVTAGAAALDAHVARKAAEAGLDLTFLRTIPGSIGGAVRMNAGCYGSYVKDVLVSVRIVTRQGELRDIPAADLNLRYRQSDLPEGAVIISATFRAAPGDPAALAARMEEQLARRDASQPTKDRSAGSTFRNPAGFSSTGRADDTHELKAWKVIDEAGMRGARRGGAQMSEMHSNFLINAGGATAADLEDLGEEVRKRVFQQSGITLEWEIMRVGERKPE